MHEKAEITLSMIDTLLRMRYRSAYARFLWFNTYNSSLEAAPIDLVKTPEGRAKVYGFLYNKGKK